MTDKIRKYIVFLIVFMLIIGSNLVSYGIPSESENPEDIFIDKQAEWIDEANGIAKIIMEVSGNEIQQGIDVVLVLDRSGSMREQQRMQKTRDAAKAFIDELYKPDGNVESDNRISMVTFSSDLRKYPNAIGEETFLAVNDIVNVDSSTKYFNDQLNITTPEGGTYYDIAFNAAEEIIDNRLDRSRPTYIVFMSDGMPEFGKDGKSKATTLKANGTKIYSLSLGLDAGNYMNYIEPLASEPTSTYAKAVTDNSDLTSIFTEIAFSIKVSGKDAIVTDFINTDNFEITTKPGDTIWFEATHGTVTKDAAEEVTWDIGDINQTLKRLTIYIKVKDRAPLGEIFTNFSAHVNYTDSNEEFSNMEFPMPRLTRIGEGDKLDITSYTGIYDGKPHSIIVNNLIEGDMVEYSTDDGSTWSDINPEFTDLIDQLIYLRVTNPHYKERTGSGRVTITERIVPNNPKPDPRPEPSDPGPFIPVKEEIIEEPIPQALPELNKEDHFQYIQGYPDNTVRPEGLITREEVAAVFFRLLTEGYRNTIRTSAHKFPDVEINRWSTKHIATLARGGIIEGYEDGSFRPGNFITRAELATIASRFDNLSPFEKNSFSDISGHWANKYINSASAKGWVNGYPDGTFKPNQYITRAEFVTLVNNVLERRVHKKDILAEAKQFPDLLETKWYYQAMQEAINSHHYNRMEDNHEKWIDIYHPKPEM